MATLQTLRNRAGVLMAVVIGLSLLAFILGDFLNSGASFLQRNQMEIGEINGKSINYFDFQARVEQSVESYKQNSGMTSLDEGTYASIRNQVWNNYMNEMLFEDEYKSLGLGCSSDELFDMVQGQNIHPQILQAPVFQNQVTGMFDRSLVIQFLKNMELEPTGQQKALWVEYEKELVKDRIFTKYQNLISKGLFVTSKMVDIDYVETNNKYDFDYVAARYATTPDSLVTVTEVDAQNYYQAHLDQFEQEASRDLSYVAWEILPSQADRDAVENWIHEQKEEFSRIENVKQFVSLNADSPFSENYFDLFLLPDTMQSWVPTANPGDVFGPYLENNDTWKLARITDIRDLPDTVKASHILIQPDNGNFDAAQKTADSILQEIKKGADFAQLALVHGTDATKDNGGDLGWFAMQEMIPEFSQACFFGQKGDLLTVKTQYGVHVIYIADQGPKSKKFQVAFLDRQITPSSQTIENIYSEASRFAATYGTSQKFEEGIQEEKLTKRLATNLREGDAAIPGLENPRELIRWAYEAKKGDLSKIYEFGNRFVIAKLTEVRDTGTAPLDQVRAQVENSVRNEKKAEYLISKINQILSSEKSLDAVASTVGTTVQQAQGAYYTSFSITGIGIEPNLTGTLPHLQINEVSGPIKGRNAVYVVKVTHSYKQETDPLESRQRLEQAYASRTGYQVFQALEKKAKVVDRRNKFY